MNVPKIIAFYLPQYHAIPENDRWWGKGFTEWTNTKKAIPLFKNHKQPKIPLDDNYYCLLDSSTQKWQSDLAQEHGIYGFCYYHYWFNGKLLLEKPMENMLKNKNITIPFCISWANEPWARTWDGKDKEVLMPQIYGGKEAWIKHLDYLIKFFRDDRYIKIDNKPLFVIYRTSSIPDCDEMINFWNQKCIENGFNGIHIVETINSFQSCSHLKNSNAVVEFEPMLTIRHHLPITTQITRLLKRKFHIIETIDYNFVWNRVLNKNIEYGKKKYLGAFVSWDNTARKGKKGLVLTNDSPESFENHFTKQYYKACKENSDFIFINAWNEWAEGTYLEPDDINQFRYLKIIQKITGNRRF